MMMPKTANVYLAILIPLIAAGMAPFRAQQGKLDLLIRGGHVIDPRNAINSVMDVGIAAGKIAEVAAKIDPARANRVTDATGLYVVPGLID